MKKLILISFAALLIGMSSCKKTFCWECTTIRVETKQDGSKETRTLSKLMYCDYTEDEIKGFEEEYYPDPDLGYITTCEKE